MAADLNDDSVYMRKMNAILCTFPCRGIPEKPAQVLDHVYIGNQRNANNPKLLRALGITHVLNCAATPSSLGSRRSEVYSSEKSVIKYQEFSGCDTENYPILNHLPQAILFLDQVKQDQGRALVHCAMGVNRSAAICVAYAMSDQDITLLNAIKKVKRIRTKLLTNRGFRRQLIEYAKQHGKLDPVDTIDSSECY